MGSYLSNENPDDYESEDEIIMPQSSPQNEGNTQQMQQDFENICLDSATDTFDATTLSTSKVGVTLNQVLQIENQLDLYEEISLVYLLYDDCEEALNKSSSLQAGSREKVLYNWAISQNLKQQEWQEKFVEAVAIIQNFQVLVNLGLSRDDLNVRFLPHHSFTSVHVNKVRKGLYLLVCEGFTNSQLEFFLKEAYADFTSKQLKFKMFDTSHLELFLLHWEHLGYITQNNLSNLCGVLKRMDQLDLCDSVKSIVPDVVQNQNQNVGQTPIKPIKTKTIDCNATFTEDVYNEILSPGSSLSDLMSLQSMKSHISADNAVFVNDSNKYYIDAKNPGYCLIINQEIFYREVSPQYTHLLPGRDIRLEARLGTQKDKEQLENTFKKFGFKTEIVNNLDHLDLVKKIESTVDRITSESSLFICILSHGDEGVVYGANSCKVPVKRIQRIMCSNNRNNLSGKPKVLILQSCQGNRCQKVATIEEEDDDLVTDGPSSPNRERVAPRADLFTFWATVPGFGAIRNKKTGTWFIQSLCEKMKELGNKNHFEDICTMVNLDVSNKKCFQNAEEVAMVPLKETTLRKLLYLPPMRQA